MKEIKGDFKGKDRKIAVVISRFNEFISNQLLSGCVDNLKKGGVQEDDIVIIWAPGSFEIPQVIVKLDTKKFDAVIALGAIIRGDTPHFDYIASEVTKGIANIALDRKIPITFGIITADTVEQAIERAGTKQGNKGRDAALSALEMISIYAQI